MTSEKINILFVDDEAMLLQGLRRMLRSMRNEWNMTFLTSGAEALAFLEDNAVDVIVSDMRMPEMTGSELLTKVRNLYPDIVRIMLSGYAGNEGILKSVGPSHQFLAKPCDADVVIDTIRRSLELRANLASAGLRKFITGIENIPILPDVYREFMEEVAKPTASTETIAAVIQRDMGMSATILKLTNSAYFSLPTRITSIRQAVQFLGLETLHSLVAVAKLFEPVDCDPDKLPLLRRFGNEAMATASLARIIAVQEKFDAAEVEQAFCAGLLSHLGNILFLMDTNDHLEEYREAIFADPTTLLESERALFGTNHAEVGAYLLSLWGFSHGIVGAVLHHHEPAKMDEESFETTTIVHVAQALLAGADNLLDKAHIGRLGKDHRIAVWRDVVAEIIKNGVSA
jgi:HD-like signal output (HDOD) protein/ActR/RegA family two-component response regulator